MSPASPRILVAPKDPNPYQELLYREVAAQGATVRYETGPTPSQSLNLLLAPLMLVWYRLRGFELLHLHWIHQFSLPWARSHPLARSAMERWFSLYLAVARLAGFTIVWTAHDLLPHWPIFGDDVRAQSVLIDHCDLVFALSSSTAEAVRALGAREVAVVPFASYLGSYDVAIDRATARERLGVGDGDVVVLNIGRLARYKGADLLLDAARALPVDSPIKVVIAGECEDAAYRAELESSASTLQGRAVVHLERIPDDEMATYLRAADLACFPFRAISNSSSILLAQSFGLPSIIPALANLADLPDASVLRYEPDGDGLRDALVEASDRAPEDLEEIARAAKSHADALDWPGAARLTLEAYTAALARRRTTARRPARVASSPPS